MTIQDAHREHYGAVLTPDWPDRVVRDHHPLDGSWVYTTETAEPDGATLLLLHGVGNDGGIWSPILPALAEGGPVVAPTVPATLLIAEGGGRAETIDLMLDHLAAVAPPPWRLVGHSMGGVLAGLVLRYRPDLVTGAVLVNSPLPSVTRRIREGDSLDRTGRALLMLKVLAHVTALGRPRLPRVLRGPELLAVRTALNGFVVDPGALDGRVVSRSIMSTRTTDGRDFIELAREIPETEATPFDAVPVTIVLGKRDPLVPESDFPGVQARYPAATIHVLDPCSHFAQFEQPARTVEIITDALRS
jgi:pimeloyl-ACP methyl ester carboxylesterase